jgi:hypothetical protein
MQRTQLLIEKIDKLFVGTPADHKALMESLQTKSEAELATTAAQLQTLRTQHERTKLELMHHGVANTERNWSILVAKFNGYFTTEQVYRAIQSDADFKPSLEWRGAPFGEVEKKQQQERAQDEKNFKLFQGCAKAATSYGRNVSGCRANYTLVKEAIEDSAQDFTTPNIMDVIFRGGLALSPNDAQVANDLVQEREDAEKAGLAEIVVDAMRSWRMDGPGGSIVRDEYGRNKALATVKTWSLRELRSRVEVIEKNRFLASLSREDAQLIARGEAMERRSEMLAGSGYAPLPETDEQGNRIDGKYLFRLSNSDFQKFKAWVKRHGGENINKRIRETQSR